MYWVLQFETLHTIHPVFCKIQKEGLVGIYHWKKDNMTYVAIANWAHKSLQRVREAVFDGAVFCYLKSGRNRTTYVQSCNEKASDHQIRFSCL